MSLNAAASPPSEEAGSLIQKIPFKDETGMIYQ
jgi:hypothetical protein